jgi:16S rRNA (uracil1498-N3)-methyltransferase
MATRYRIYVADDLHENAVLIFTDKQAHYLIHVLRAKVGMVLALFNGKQGEWLASISEIAKKQVTLRVVSQSRPMQKTPNLIACIAPIKGGRFDGMLEKATELGAAKIQPVITQHCVVRKVNEQRLQAITREAAEQSERVDTPEIAPICGFSDFLQNWDNSLPLFYGDESGASGAFDENALKAIDCSNGWGVLIGPEGGFSGDELAQLRAASGVYGLSLGPRILRSETACTTLCAITMQLFGDWNAHPAFKRQTI